MSIISRLFGNYHKQYIETLFMLVDDKKQSFFNLSFTYLTRSWKKYTSDAKKKKEVITRITLV